MTALEIYGVNLYDSKQSNLVISNFKGLAETLLDNRSPKYQSEETINRKTTFNK